MYGVIICKQSEIIIGKVPKYRNGVFIIVSSHSGFTNEFIYSSISGNKLRIIMKQVIKNGIAPAKRILKNPKYFYN